MNLDDLEAKVERAYNLLKSLGYTSDMENGSIQLKKRNDPTSDVTDNRRPDDVIAGDDSDDDYGAYDHPFKEDWSEYDSWGYDRKKKGLGSIV